MPCASRSGADAAAGNEHVLDLLGAQGIEQGGHALLGRQVREPGLRANHQEVRLEAGFRYVCNLIPKSNLYSLNAHRKVGNRMHHRPILKLPAVGPRFMGLGAEASWDALRPASW